MSGNPFSYRNHMISCEPRTDDEGVYEEHAPKETDEDGTESNGWQKKRGFLNML